MEARELKIGDKLYNAHQDGFDDFMRYDFSEVVALTKTLAILKNGVRLINKPRTSFLETYGYSVSQNKSKHWHLVSLNVIRSAQIENEKIKIDDWFETKKFTMEEKKKIYRAFSCSTSKQL